MKSLRNVKRVELVRIPVLVVCVIPSAFKCVEDVKMENARLFESIRELKEAIERKKREEEERKRRQEEERRRREEEKRGGEERRKRGGKDRKKKKGGGERLKRGRGKKLKKRQPWQRGGL